MLILSKQNKRRSRTSKKYAKLEDALIESSGRPDSSKQKASNSAEALRILDRHKKEDLNPMVDEYRTVNGFPSPSGRYEGGKVERKLKSDKLVKRHAGSPTITFG